MPDVGALNIKVNIDLGYASRQLHALENVITELSKSGEIDLRKLVNDFDTLNTKLKGMEQGTTSLQGMQKTALGFAGLGGAITSIQTLAAGAMGLGRALLQPAADMEQTKTSLNVLAGSAEKAGFMMKDLGVYAAKTPYEFPDLAASVKMMMGFNISMQDSMENVKMLGDIAMGDAGKMQSLTLAFSQMTAAGRLQSQDLLQMINAGFNPLNEIAKRTGKSMSELKQSMEKGAISANMVRDAFKSATVEGGLFYKMGEKQSQSFNGLMSTMRDNFGMTMREIIGISQSGDIRKDSIFDTMKQQLTALLDFINNNQDKIVALGKTISDVMLGTAKTIISIVKPIISLIDILKPLAPMIAVITTAMILQKNAMVQTMATKISSFFSDLQLKMEQAAVSALRGQLSFKATGAQLKSLASSMFSSTNIIAMAAMAAQTIINAVLNDIERSQKQIDKLQSNTYKEDQDKLIKLYHLAGQQLEKNGEVADAVKDNFKAMYKAGILSEQEYQDITAKGHQNKFFFMQKEAELKNRLAAQDKAHTEQEVSNIDTTTTSIKSRAEQLKDYIALKVREKDITDKTSDAEFSSIKTNLLAYKEFEKTLTDAEKIRLDVALRKKKDTEEEKKDLKDLYAAYDENYKKELEKEKLFIDLMADGSAKEKALRDFNMNAELDALDTMELSKEEYAKATLLIQQKYARLAKEPENQITPDNTKYEENLNNLVNAFSPLQSMLEGVLTGTQSIAEGFKAMGKAIIAELAKVLASSIVKKFASFLLAPAGGGIGGGILSFLGFSEGGAIPAMATGGMIWGGIRGVDSVPIMAMGGEYILNREATSRIGKDKLDAMNSGVNVGSGGGSLTIHQHIGIVAGKERDARELQRTALARAQKDYEWAKKG